jgi:hypothetical protein
MAHMTTPKPNVTILTNIYNEQWLLPFWIEHHAPLCSRCIIFDYGCTDNSLNIIRSQAPASWEVRKSRNGQFDAAAIDTEFMDAERQLRRDGDKSFFIVLNTTEFLVTEHERLRERTDAPTTAAAATTTTTTEGDPSTGGAGPPADAAAAPRVCLDIPCYVALHSARNNPTSLRQLWEELSSVVPPPNNRYSRYLHNHDNGQYHVGRHFSRHPTTPFLGAYIVWLGFYPWNDQQLGRKLQIQQRMPDSDKRVGNGFQHLWSAQRMEQEWLAFRSRAHALSAHMRGLLCSEECKTEEPPALEPAEPEEEHLAA